MWLLVTDTFNTFCRDSNSLSIKNCCTRTWIVPLLMTKTWPLMIRRFLTEPFEDFVFLIALIASLKQVSEPSSEKNTDFDVDQTFQWDRAIKAPD